MDKLLPGLIVAALSGLTFLAYKHPKAYQKIFTWLMWSSWALIAGLLIWDFSITRTMGVMLPFVESGKIDQAVKASHELSILNLQLIVEFALCQFYLVFLVSLPLILGSEKQPPDEKSEAKNNNEIK